MEWAALPHHILLAMKFCFATAQKQWSQLPTDWHFWNDRPKIHIFSFKLIFSGVLAQWWNLTNSVRGPHPSWEGREVWEKHGRLKTSFPTEVVQCVGGVTCSWQLQQDHRHIYRCQWTVTRTKWIKAHPMGTDAGRSNGGSSNPLLLKPGNMESWNLS
jgi:hypothetical protein